MVATSAEQTSGSDLRTAALVLFTRKYPTMLAALKFQAARRGWRGEYFDDAAQTSAIELWERCLNLAARQAGELMNTNYPALEALRQVGRDAIRQNPPGGRLLSLSSPLPSGRGELADTVPAPCASIRVDGVTLTTADARLDADYWTALEGTPEADFARKHGLSPYRVQHLRQKLEAVYVDGEGWFFPPAAAPPSSSHRRPHGTDPAEAIHS